jgi:hypothetical protein
MRASFLTRSAFAGTEPECVYFYITAEWPTIQQIILCMSRIWNLR